MGDIARGEFCAVVIGVCVALDEADFGGGRLDGRPLTWSSKLCILFSNIRMPSSSPSSSWRSVGCSEGGGTFPEAAEPEGESGLGEDGEGAGGEAVKGGGS